MSGALKLVSAARSGAPQRSSPSRSTSARDLCGNRDNRAIETVMSVKVPSVLKNSRFRRVHSSCFYRCMWCERKALHVNLAWPTLAGRVALPVLDQPLPTFSKQVYYCTTRSDFVRGTVPQSCSLPHRSERLLLHVIPFLLLLLLVFSKKPFLCIFSYITCIYDNILTI